MEVVCFNEVFPLGTSDQDWIPHVAAKGWAIITKDRAQDVNPIELLLLWRHGAKRYVISERGLKGPEIAERIIANRRKIENTFHSQPAPFIYTIGKRGLSLFLSRTRMKRRLKGFGQI